MAGVAKGKKKSKVAPRPKTGKEIIRETFSPTDDEILRIYPVGDTYFRLNFWNKRGTGIVRSLFIEVADGKAAVWPEGAAS